MLYWVENIKNIGSVTNQRNLMSLKLKKDIKHYCFLFSQYNENKKKF